MANHQDFTSVEPHQSFFNKRNLKIPVPSHGAYECLPSKTIEKAEQSATT